VEASPAERGEKCGLPDMCFTRRGLFGFGGTPWVRSHSARQSGGREPVSASGWFFPDRVHPDSLFSTPGVFPEENASLAWGLQCKPAQSGKV